MAAQHDGGLAALDCLAIAVLLVDATLAVVFANRAARALFDGDCPLSLNGDRLNCGDGARELALRLRHALDSPCSRGPLSFALSRQGRPALTVCVAPLHRRYALVIARGPEMAVAAPAALRQLYGLTPTEADVASELAQGRTLADIARRHDISVNTIKTHLHRLYRKTATRRQGELIALIHGSTATLGAALFSSLIHSDDAPPPSAA